MNLCKCGKEKSTEKSVYCRPCNNAYQAVIKANKRAKGLCLSCWRTADSGVYCLVCSNRRKPNAAKSATIKREQRRVNGLCIQCGELNQGKPRCQKCMALKTKNACIRHAELKAKCVQLLGGKCADCNLVSEFNEVYDFHHLDPSKKEYHIAKLLACHSWDKLVEELKKCVMICANCHRIRHAKEDTCLKA